MSSGVPFKRWVRLLRVLCYLNSGACLVERRVCCPQPKDLLPPLSHNPLCHQQFHSTAHKQMHWSLTVEEEGCWEWGLFIKRVDCCLQSGTWKTFWLTPERWINTNEGNFNYTTCSDLQVVVCVAWRAVCARQFESIDCSNLWTCQQNQSGSHVKNNLCSLTQTFRVIGSSISKTLNLCTSV